MVAVFGGRGGLGLVAAEANNFLFHLGEFLGLATLLLVELLHLELKSAALLSDSLVLHLFLLNLHKGSVYVTVVGYMRAKVMRGTHNLGRVWHAAPTAVCWVAASAIIESVKKYVPIELCATFAVVGVSIGGAKGRRVWCVPSATRGAGKQSVGILTLE